MYKCPSYYNDENELCDCNCGKCMKKEYKDGMDMKTLQHLPEVSVYNYNYYVGLNKEILLGKSDDDNTTEWSIISEYNKKLLGYSYTSRGEKLELTNVYRT